MALGGTDVVTVVGVLSGLLGALFVGLSVSAAWTRMVEARNQRRRRRARKLLPGGQATESPPPSPPAGEDLLALAPELRGLLAEVERLPDAGAVLSEWQEALRKRVAAQLGRALGAWQGGWFRRRRARPELLGGLTLLERLPAEANLTLLVRMLHLPDGLVVAGTASTLSRQPAVYSGAIVPLAAVLRVAEPLGRPHVEQALRALLATHPEMIPLLASDPSHLVRRSVVRAAGSALGASRSEIDHDLNERLAEVVIAGSLDPEEEVRTVACRALEGVAKPRRFSELERLLFDDSDRVRMAATRSLRASGDPRAVRLLVGRLKGAPPALTREILQALPDLPRTENRWVVSRLARRGRGERVAALRALGALGGEAEALKIVRLIEDGNPRVRLEASLALAGFGRLPSLPLRGTEVVERLGRRLAVELDDRVAAGLAEALASSGDAGSAAPLIARIEHGSAVLREQLVEGLALLNLLMSAGSRARGAN